MPLLVGGIILLLGIGAFVVLNAGGDDDDAGSTTTTADEVVGPVAPSTVARDGDPEFCAALVDFQALVTAVSEPDPNATPDAVEQDWNDLAESEGHMIENAPEELAGATQQVAAAFDQFRLDAENLAFDYENFGDLPSGESIDPGSSIAAAAAALFTYGDERCPETP